MCFTVWYSLLVAVCGCLCRNLDEVEVMMVNDGTSSYCFTQVENFDTDVLSCLNDPKKALSYQTG